MASQATNRAEYYNANFSTDRYLTHTSISDKADPVTARFFKAFTEMYHEVFSANRGGERLLDLGSGPTVWHIASASAKYRNITLSKFVDSNRETLHQYMADHSIDAMWTDHFKLTAKLEGDESKWQEVRDRVRASIREVSPCDVLQDQPLGKTPAELYDCVFASLCFEGACTTVASYRKAVKNTVALAKPGASIVFAGTLGETYYQFGGSRFDCVTLTPDIIRKSLEDAGCTVDNLVTRPTDQKNSDSCVIYFVEATKR